MQAPVVPPHCDTFSSSLRFEAAAGDRVAMHVESSDVRLESLWIGDDQGDQHDEAIVSNDPSVGARAVIGPHVLSEVDNGYRAGIAWSLEGESAPIDGTFNVLITRLAPLSGSPYMPQVAAVPGAFRLDQYDAWELVGYKDAYIAGVLDGFFQLWHEVDSIRTMAEPPQLPAETAPIPSERWDSSSAQDKTDLALELAAWKAGRIVRSGGPMEDLNLGGFFADVSAHIAALQGSGSEYVAAVAWSVLARSEPPAVQPVLTKSGGYLSVPRGIPLNRSEYPYYLGGVVDAFKVFTWETVTIRDSETPPVLPSDVTPITSERWIEMAEAGNRFSYAAKLAMEPLLRGVLSPLLDRSLGVDSVRTGVLPRFIGSEWLWDDETKGRSLALLLWQALANELSAP